MTHARSSQAPSPPEFEERIERYPGEVESVHRFAGENGRGESFGLSLLISRRITPVAVDTLSKQRIRTRKARAQHARVSAHTTSPDGITHQGPVNHSRHAAYLMITICFVCAAPLIVARSQNTPAGTLRPAMSRRSQFHRCSPAGSAPLNMHRTRLPSGSKTASVA